ncbi:MAG TPA: MFS transporter [Verrucomicrobiae bacterium]|jgi:sugar phosphate permease|nr:MFS transporter [Verrucomicrobiae bacterium]
MPDTTRTSAPATAVTQEIAASKPTKTRWLVLVLISFMYLITYMDRSNISVAQPEIAKQFGLDKSAMGWVLAAFTWAYALGQVPSGWLGDRFGPKRVLTVIMTLWSATAAMTGAALGFWTLFGARFLLGLSESGAFPVASRGMQLWFPRVERGRIQGTTHFFSRFAVAVTPFIAGSILIAFGWRAIFYIFGSLGILWAIAFSLFYRDIPEEHKSVNRIELARIRGVNRDGTIKPPAISRLPTPWRRILLSPNMWFISLGYFCFFFGTNFYLTWYPTYLREHLHMSIRSLGIWGSLPLFAGMAGDIIGGSLSDLIFKATGKARLARRVVAAPGFLLASAFVIPAALTANKFGSILYLAVSFFFLEWVIGPAWAVPMDVGGQFSGTVTGVMNMVGALGGAATAVVYGKLFNRGFWVAPFLVSAGVMLVGALIWVFLIDPEKSVVEGPLSAGAALS